MWCLDLVERDGASAPPTPACFPLLIRLAVSLDCIGGRQRVNLEEVPSGASAGLTPRGGEEEMPRRRGGGDATAARRSIGEAARPAAQGDYRRTSSAGGSSRRDQISDFGAQLCISWMCSRAMSYLLFCVFF
ncbi:uncharacterized protein LOC124666121 [Lolium rigidum]|uniref:uncharacterized protein LOC124666121 n=1 Tax=Lolium rigidum TaxID=89674 RepID=UPI001F5D2B26|nr:uncharacterized protein LOC124666121 [Lolium rigidum]